MEGGQLQGIPHPRNPSGSRGQDQLHNLQNKLCKLHMQIQCKLKKLSPFLPKVITDFKMVTTEQ
jgi:hypothetical protein